MTGQNLDGYLSAEFGVCGAIHLPHAAGAECGEDLVRSEFVACSERHMSGSAKFSRSGAGCAWIRATRKQCRPFSGLADRPS